MSERKRVEFTFTNEDSVFVSEYFDASIVIDMQNDFIDGALGTKEARAIVPDVVRKLEITLTTDQTEELSAMSTVADIAGYLAQLV